MKARFTEHGTVPVVGFPDTVRAHGNHLTGPQPVTGDDWINSGFVDPQGQAISLQFLETIPPRVVEQGRFVAGPHPFEVLAGQFDGEKKRVMKWPLVLSWDSIGIIAFALLATGY